MNLPLKTAVTLFILLLSVNIFGQPKPVGELIFPLQEKHVHSSSIVELPNGDLLVCWFKGSGERWSNDVFIQGARLRKGESKWSEPFLMADTPGQPDCNPMMFLNQEVYITTKSGITDAGGWKTGITMADVNGDGFLDFYVCRAGLNAENRENLLEVDLDVEDPTTPDGEQAPTLLQGCGV